MLSQEELNRLVEIDICMELLEEYNEFEDVKEGFDLKKSRECLENMTLKELQEKSEQIADLISKHNFIIYMDNIIKDIKEYGLDYAKNKYKLEGI